MKKRIVIFGLVGCLSLGSVSFATNQVDNKETQQKTISTIVDIEDGINVETKVIPVDLKGANTEVKIPVIKGLSDVKYQEELNYFIEVYV